MQSKPADNLYEYAVIRYVPRVEREEFINVGLIMMCKRRRWIRTAIVADLSRAAAFFPETDEAALRNQLKSFEEVASGRAVPLGELEVHERFRWLTAVRSASISTSRPHPGKCTDLEETFDRLFKELVE